MNLEEVRNYCISRPGVTEGLPFNDTALVFKVYNKMFAILDLSDDARGISLKCDPELAVDLREQYDEVTAAWHLSKVHWNAVYLNGNINFDQLKGWIDHSYDLVYASLPAKTRSEIEKK